MNALDIAVLLILGIGAIAGIRKGFISQAFAIIAILLSAWLSFTCAGAISEWIASWVKAEGVWLKLITFLLIFIVIGILCRLIGKVIESIFKVAMLGWLNRLFGAVLSVCKYLIVMGLVAILFNTANNEFKWVDEKELAQSKAFVAIRDGAYRLFPYFKEMLSGSAVIDANRSSGAKTGV